MKEQVNMALYYIVVAAGSGTLAWALTRFIVWLDRGCR